MSRLTDLYKKIMYGQAGMDMPGQGMSRGTQGLFGQGGQQSGGLIDFNKMNNQQGGGLLGNIPQSALLGSAIFGQGVQGKDPFSALLPAVAQTSQLQQLMTPKKSFRQLTDAEKQSRGLPLDKQFQVGADNKVMQIGGSGTNVTVNTPFETAEEKEISKVFGEEFKEINKAGNLANVNDQKLEILMNLNESENLRSGKFGEFRTEAQKLAEEFGFDPGLQDTTVAEIVGGVSGGLVLDGLQKFSGAISDGERNYTKSITPGLSTTKEGNRYLLQINKRQNELAKEFSNVANDWISRNGGLSKKDKELGSWGSYKKQWHKANPLINPEMKTKLTALSKTVDTEFGKNVKIITRNGKQIKGVKIDGNWYEL